jgi:preprotein translocase subunit SecE
MQIPLNILILLILFGVAIILYFLKHLLFKRFEKIKPEDVRETASYDGHTCNSSYESMVDNWLFAHKIPHNLPLVAKINEFFTNSAGVPNFIIFTDWKATKIHSIIEITGLERPKKITRIIHTPDIKPKYPLFRISLEELQLGSWQKNAYRFYKELREEIRKWAENEEANLTKNPKKTN